MIQRMTPGFDAIEEKRISTDSGAILFDAARIAQPEPALLDAERWPAAGGRGRGVVRRVSGDFGSAVLRPYRRGGLVARLNRERYLWAGEDRTRPFLEFRLLAGMRARGLPVPAPLAAGYTRHGLWYRAQILTAEIGGATTLAEGLRERMGDGDAWVALGDTLARFHAAGICHADLNAHNLLFDGERRWWLIDFDRGGWRKPDPRWPQTRLARLQRSLRKLGAADLAAWPQVWQQLQQAHDVALRRALDDPANP